MADERLTYVNIGPHGTFGASGTLLTSTADIDAIFAYVKAKGINKLALHFHGGLVSESKGKEIADKMRPVYEAAKCHPVSFIWETGLLETVERNLATIHRTKLFQKLLFWIIKKAAKCLGLDVGGRGPGEPTDAEILSELQKEFPFEELQIKAGARGGMQGLSEADLNVTEQQIRAELEQEMLTDESFLALLQGTHTGFDKQAVDKLSPPKLEGAKGLLGIDDAFIVVAKIAISVLTRFIKERDHGFYPTIIEEILRELYLADLGEWVWDGMKEAAKSMWLSNEGVVGDKRHVGRYFLQGLEKLQTSKGVSIDLVGHSAGSIAICHLLGATKAANMNITFRNIVLLAPAARADLFYEEIASKPERYDALRMYTMSDEYECLDRLAGPLYTRSLLYFISGVLEDGYDAPICGMHRFLSPEANCMDVPLPEIRSFINAGGQNRLVLSLSRVLNSEAPPGFQSNAAKHGDFDDDPDTRASLTHMLSICADRPCL